MNARGTYNLCCVLLIAGRPPGSDRAAQARSADGPDRSGETWRCWLSADELRGGRPWPALSLDLLPEGRTPPLEAAPVRIGERHAWTDPPGL